MAFDVRVGLYDDPPNKTTVKMTKANSERIKLAGELNKGLMSLLFRLVWTPSYSKFCEAQDTTFGISQRIVDKKVAELKNMAEQGESFQENTGKYESCLKMNVYFFCTMERRCNDMPREQSNYIVISSNRYIETPYVMIW